MLVVQILIAVFALFAIARAVSQYKQGRVPRTWLAFWVFFWLGAAIVAVLPWTTEVLARVLGVGRGVDAVMYVSLVVLFYLVFRLFVKVEDVERQITKLVRKVALEEVESAKD